MKASFDRDGFQKRVSAILKDDLGRNGRITLDGINFVGAEAEFYARRLTREAAARIEGLVDALKPFAMAAEGWPPHIADEHCVQPGPMPLTLGDLRKARQAYALSNTEGEG